MNPSSSSSSSVWNLIFPVKNKQIPVSILPSRSSIFTILNTYYTADIFWRYLKKRLLFFRACLLSAVVKAFCPIFNVLLFEGFKIYNIYVEAINYSWKNREEIIDVKNCMCDKDYGWFACNITLILFSRFTQDIFLQLLRQYIEV